MTAEQRKALALVLHRIEFIDEWTDDDSKPISCPSCQEKKRGGLYGNLVGIVHKDDCELLAAVELLAPLVEEI